MLIWIKITNQVSNSENQRKRSVNLAQYRVLLSAHRRYHAGSFWEKSTGTSIMEIKVSMRIYLWDLISSFFNSECSVEALEHNQSRWRQNFLPCGQGFSSLVNVQMCSNLDLISMPFFLYVWCTSHQLVSAFVIEIV